MAQRLKSWESPRRKGRNIKGKGGSARQRQLKKQQQMLRKKLKGESPDSKTNNNKEKRTSVLFSFCLGAKKRLELGRRSQYKPIADNCMAKSSCRDGHLWRLPTFATNSFLSI